MPSLIETLRRVPLLNELSELELRTLSERITCREFEAGEVVFSEGAPCRELWIMAAGIVRIVKTARNGRQQLISIERAGNSLSEVGVFDHGAYPGTAIAESGVTLLRLDAAEFRRICVNNPDLALKVIKVLGHRLRRMGALVEELSFATVRGRLIAHLSELARELGRSTQDGVAFELKENNEELAVRLGTVRELVSRNLGRLHGEGLIEMRRRTVIIRDPEKFSEEALRSA